MTCFSTRMRVALSFALFTLKTFTRKLAHTHTHTQALLFKGTAKNQLPMSENINFQLHICIYLKECSNIL